MNFELPENIITREKYLSKVIPFINKSLIKVFVGQRRVGKSYILFQIMQHISRQFPYANIIYINKEDVSFDFITNYKDLEKYVSEKLLPRKKNFLFIDEIQEIENFEKAIRSLSLKKNLDIYLTGSNAKIFSSEVSTLLAGRSIEIPVYSLSYSEFLSFHKLKDTDENLRKYLQFGGLPYLVNLELKSDIVFEYLKNIYSTIVFRDVVIRNNLRSTFFLERLIKFLADNIGNIFSSKKISDYLKSQKIKISHVQVQNFIDFLTEAFIIARASRYDIKGKKIFEIGEKYYFEDLGIRNVIVGFKPGDLSKLIENVVFNHLLISGYKVKIGKLNNEEIDFIAEKNNELVYIQVTQQLTSSEIIEREFGNLLKIKDSYPKLVISLDKTFRNTFEGVRHLSLNEFLLNFQ